MLIIRITNIIEGPSSHKYDRGGPFDAERTGCNESEAPYSEKISMWQIVMNLPHVISRELRLNSAFSYE